jgi:hypothetical protein
MQNAIDWEFGFVNPRSAFGALQKNGSQKTNSKKFAIMLDLVQTLLIH